MAKANSDREFVLFSFFSGSGMLDLGFEDEGYKVVFVNEISKSFLNAYRHSRLKLGYSEPKFGYQDVSIDEFLGVKQDLLRDYMQKCDKNATLIGFIGGPPCPDFSVAGKNKGSEGENGRLSLTYVNLIIALQPDYFLYENVKGLWKTLRHRKFYEDMKKRLHEAGYSTSEKLCNAIEFGVPQDRERVFLVGVRNDILEQGILFNNDLLNFGWTENSLYETQKVKNLLWADTSPFGENSSTGNKPPIENLTIQYWFDKNDVENHPNSDAYFQPRSGITKIKTIPEGDVSKKSYKRLHRNRYSPTAAYGNNEVHLHPYRERRISVAEAMAIQSMPKEFELPQGMSLTDMFKTVANGVPYLMARGIAKTLREYLENNTCKK